MTDTTINIKVSADIREAAAQMKQLHKIASQPNKQTVQQQKVVAKGNTKAQQSAVNAVRMSKTQNAQLKAHNQLLQQQNKLIQQNLQLQQKAVTQTKRVSRAAGFGAGGPMGPGGTGGGGGGGGPGGGRARQGPLARAARGGGGMGGIGMWALGGAVGIASYLVGSLVNMVTSQIAPSDAAFTNFSKASIPLQALGSPAAIRGAAQRGRKFGFTELESIQHMRDVSRATGSIEDVTTAQGVARFMGMDVGEVASHMGMLTRAGEGGKGARGERALHRLMSTAVASGLDKSRAGEHLQAVSGLVELAGSRTAGAVDASSISGLLAFFSKTGHAGLQGARGANALRQLDEVMVRAGQGDTSETSALVLRGLGFGVGGKTNLYDAQARAQQGIFGARGAENLVAMMRQFDIEAGHNREGRNLLLNRATGLSYDLGDQIWNAIRKGGNVSEEVARLTAAEAPTEQQLLDVIRGPALDRLQVIADTETQQITQGEQIAGSLNDIRTAINELVRQNWPILVNLLRIVADAATILADVARAQFRGVTAAGEAERNLAEVNEIYQARLAAATDAGERFNIAGEYRMHLERIQRELALVHENEGYGTAAVDRSSADGGEGRRRRLEEAERRVGDQIMRVDTERYMARRELNDREFEAMQRAAEAERQAQEMMQQMQQLLRDRGEVVVAQPPGADVASQRATAMPQARTSR